MQRFHLLKYFLYLSYHWNLRIACHITSAELYGERKYNINTTGADELKSLEKKGVDISHATIYMPASYDLLEIFFNKISIHTKQHFLDVGCGKGRTLCVAAAYGVPKVSGVDFSKVLLTQAAENLVSVSRNRDFVYTLKNDDAFYFEIASDVDCIFLFNPFDEIIMSGFILNLQASILAKPRKITIIYFNPLQKHLLHDAGFTQIFHLQKFHYLEGIIMEN